MIVQKFSGSALSTADRIKDTVLPQIMQRHDEGEMPRVVVSATGKTTDISVFAAEQSLEGNSEDANRIIQEIREQHYNVLEGIIDDPNELASSKECIDTQLRSMTDINRGIFNIREFTPTVKDRILAIGEKLSACVITGALNAAGYESVMVDLSELFSREEITDRTTDEQILEKIKERLNEVPEGIIPVITGFIGGFEGGIVGRIGRGYSDLTASYIGVISGANMMEKWTATEGSISGITVSHEEMLEMNQSDAWTIHSSCIEVLKQAGIPIHLRNVDNPEDAGLLVTETDQKTESLFKAVTVKRGVTILSIKTPRMLDSFGYLERVSALFSKHRISIDFVTTSKVNISFVVDQNPEKLQSLISDLEQLGQVNAINGKSTLSIVGSELQNSASTIGKIFTALAEQQIPVDTVAMSDNSIVLRLVIEDKYVDDAIDTLNQIK